MSRLELERVEPHRWLATTQRAFEGLSKCADEGFAFAELRVSAGLVQRASSAELADRVEQLLNEARPEKIRVVTDGDRGEAVAALRARVDLTKVLWHEYSSGRDADAANANFCMPEPNVRRLWERAGCRGPLAIGGDPGVLGADFKERWTSAFQQLIEALEAVHGPGGLDDDADEPGLDPIEDELPEPQAAWTVVRVPRLAANSPYTIAAAAVDARPINSAVWSGARWEGVDLRLEAQWHDTVITIRLSGTLEAGSTRISAVRFVDEDGLIVQTGAVRWHAYPAASPPYASAMFEFSDQHGALQRRLQGPGVEAQLLGGQ